MKIRKFAALSVLVFGTIAANDVAPSNSELEAMYDKAYRAFDAANYTEALKQLDAIDARKPDLAASPCPKPEGLIRNFGMPVSIWLRFRF